MPNMPHCIAVANQKGGVGKTTSVINIAAYAVCAGRSCLIIDLDPQGNASSVYAADYRGPSVFSCDSIVTTDYPGLAICPRGDDLDAWERRLAGDRSGAEHLRQRIKAIGQDYDLILIDCPPNLNVLPHVALQAADSLLIPIQCEYYAMEGLGQILHFIDHLADEGLHHPQLAGILLTMFDGEQSLCQQVATEIRNHFGDTVLTNPIPRDVALAAAPSHSQSILDYDPLSLGAIAYLDVTKELLDGLTQAV
jgi:chromosome partitioning protein